MSDAANTPKIRAIDSTRLSDATGVASTSDATRSWSATANLVTETEGATVLAPVIDIERLWEAPPGMSSQVVRALELLKQASGFIADAQRCENPMEADRFVQRVQVTLPKLFMCRTIGDGFAIIVNSLQFAFENLHGKPLNPEQLNVVWRVLKELRTRPVMTFEQALQRVEELEEKGFEVDPPGMGDLLEDLNPENSND